MPAPLASLNTLLQRLQSARRVAIFTHHRPDPDALGSQAAAACILKSLAATEIHLLQFTEAPPPYRFLQENLPADIDLWSSEWAGSVGGALDTILAVDTCTYSQMEPAATFLKAQREKIVAIDHHLTRDDLAPVIFADTSAASCTEILFQIARAAGTPLTPQLALPLMAGLTGDTGWFRFDSVTPPPTTSPPNSSPTSTPPNFTNDSCKPKPDPNSTSCNAPSPSCSWHDLNRFACMILRQSDFAQTGGTLSQTEYLVDLPMIVASCEVTALLTELSDGRIRCSLRSKLHLDVNKICRQFGGGGHAKAAGCRFDPPIEQAQSLLTTAISQALHPKS